MCTAITMQTSQGENFFGRTMDFSYPIEPGLYVIPKLYEWHSLATNKKYIDRYSFISIGQETDGMLGFFDGVNDHGFAAAVLYFEGYAHYDTPAGNKEAIGSIDFLHLILGRCASVDDLKALIEKFHIVGVPDPVTQRAAPLHWVATDRSGRCVVVEQTIRGLEIISNPIGVMANSPDFHWHMTNLRNYMNASVTQKNSVQWGDITLTPFGQGTGTMPLPGGFTSPERFVRAAFFKTHVPTPKTVSEAVTTSFHIMNSVFIPKGIVVTDRGTDDYTKYIAFMNTKTAEYYFKTYNNPQLLSASLSDYQSDSTQPIFLGNLEGV